MEYPYFILLILWILQHQGYSRFFIRQCIGFLTSCRSSTFTGSCRGIQTLPCSDFLRQKWPQFRISCVETWVLSSKRRTTETVCKCPIDVSRERQTKWRMVRERKLRLLFTFTRFLEFRRSTPGTVRRGRGSQFNNSPRFVTIFPPGSVFGERYAQNQNKNYKKR